MSLRPLPRFAITKLLLPVASGDGDKDLSVVAERFRITGYWLRSSLKFNTKRSRTTGAFAQTDTDNRPSDY
jgi:hypothetical protein